MIPFFCLVPLTMFLYSWISQILNTRILSLPWNLKRDNKLSFLYINIEKSKSSFVTSVYRKPTFTGLMSKFNSDIPLQFKHNLISNLVSRAYNLCSSCVILHNELDFITNMLFLNVFSRSFTLTATERQLNKVHRKIIPIPTVNKLPVYCCMPFCRST